MGLALCFRRGMDGRITSGHDEGMVAMASISSGNLGQELPDAALPDEIVEGLAEKSGVRIERIVSTGQATPDGEWYDQSRDEFVLLVSGAARLQIEGEGKSAGLIPATGSSCRLIAAIGCAGLKLCSPRCGLRCSSAKLAVSRAGCHWVAIPVQI